MKLAGDIPITKIQLKLKNRKIIATAFHLCPDPVPLAPVAYVPPIQISPIAASPQQQRVSEKVTIKPENASVQKSKRDKAQHWPLLQKRALKTHEQKAKSQKKSQKKDRKKYRKKSF